MKNTIKLISADISIEAAREMFWVDTKIKLFDYLTEPDTFPYLQALCNFGDKITEDMSETVIMARARDCREFLIDFADFLIADQNVLLFPYIATIGAFVASQDSTTHYEAIRTLFDRLDENFKQLDETDAEELTFVTYYSAARMLPFEHAFAQRMHSKVYDVLSNAYYNDYEKYAEYLSLGAWSMMYSEFSSLFPTGETLLLSHYDEKMNDLTDDSNFEDTSMERIASNLEDKIVISQITTLRLQDISPLGVAAVEVFSNALGELIYHDEKSAENLIKKSMVACIGAGEQVNQSLVRELQIQRQLLINKTEKKENLSWVTESAGVASTIDPAREQSPHKAVWPNAQFGVAQPG